jgi:hypothetical protein
MLAVVGINFRWNFVTEFRSLNQFKVLEKVQKTHKLLVINLCAFGIAAATMSRPRLILVIPYHPEFPLSNAFENILSRFAAVDDATRVCDFGFDFEF